VRKEKVGKPVIGFDLGGTKMLSALVYEGKIIERIKEKTKAEKGQSSVAQGIVNTIKETLKEGGIKKSDCAGACLAVPGPIDVKTGTLVKTPNLGFTDFPLISMLKKHFPFPIFLENDVNAGTYGEFVSGAAKGYEHVIALFPGTGIGGGIILNGRLYRGATGNAGEIGHMIIQTNGPRCGCGQYGCLESLASRTAMTKETIALTSSGKAPLTLEEAETDFKNYKSGVYHKALIKNERPVVEVIDRAAHFLGIGMANCVNIFNPQLIVLGGGLVEKLGDYYLSKAGESMRLHAMAALVEGVEVKPAELGDDATILGAAGIAEEETRE
jgi:glucokinase